jgi:C4-dicarboxylate transporter DctM subunit
MTEILMLFGLLFLFATLTIPIGISLGLATFFTLALMTNIPDAVISQKVFTGLDSFALMAIPFFMLAGNLMALGGIARRIVNVADLILGKIVGGLGLVTTAACMFFAALSGSGPATVSAIGSMMIPEMEKRGYDRGFSTGLTATAGTIGVIIPPSIPFVIYGVVAGVSVGDMFIAGIIPGIAIGVALMIVVLVISVKRGYKGSNAAVVTDVATTEIIDGVPTEEQLAALKKNKGCLFQILDSIPALLAPVIILGGIYGGIFTPTEASVVAIVYSLVVGKFYYKEITWKIWVDSLKSTADLTGLSCLALGFSMAFSAFLAMNQLPIKISALITEAIHSFVPMMLIILLILLILGCFIDNISSCLILTPVFLPIVKAFGMDPVHFGVTMTIALAIGFVTPPYGANLFVASAITGLPVEKVAKSAVPFLCAMAAVLLLVAFVPDISMGLVKMMRG